MRDINHITVSIVSHGQFNILRPLLVISEIANIKKIILTINIDEEIVNQMD